MRKDFGEAFLSAFYVQYLTCDATLVMGNSTCPNEVQSKLLVSPLITPIVFPYIVPYITPFEEIGKWPK